MYFILLAFCLVISYFLITLFFQLFFHGKIEKTSFRISHILIILGFLFGTIFIVNHIPDGELANRFQHAVGGGVMVVLVSYLSYKTSNISLSRFQFFCLSILLTTVFGVANELAESVFQLQSILVFSNSIADTWYDLWANSIGGFLGAVVLTYFIKK